MPMDFLLMCCESLHTGAVGRLPGLSVEEGEDPHDAECVQAGSSWLPGQFSGKGFLHSHKVSGEWGMFR